jgi:alpha-beta hydrolase superfamily lysophospholipase
MEMQQHVLGETFIRRFAGPDPRYAMVISHGMGAHSGIYNAFCTHHAARGVDIWAYDAPGHGLSTTSRPRGQFVFAEWADTCVGVAEHVRAETGLPVVSLGSSLGTAAAFSSLHSDAIVAGVLMGAVSVPSAAGGIPTSNPLRSNEVCMLERMFGRALQFDIGHFIDFDKDYGYPGAGEQKRRDVLNIWQYEFSSWRSLFTFDPVVPADRNAKPVLFAVGDDDGMTPVDRARACAASIAGPVRFEVIPGGKHQLMLFNTAVFSDLLEDWLADIV